MTLHSQQLTSQSYILGFDPGRYKCGLAVMSVDRTVHLHRVVTATAVITQVNKLYQHYPFAFIVMGDQTTSSQWQQRLAQELPRPLPIVGVDERYSSLEARDRYWQMYPPRGLARLIPTGMRTPPCAIDDIVAILLIERYLESQDDYRTTRI